MFIYKQRRFSVWRQQRMALFIICAYDFESEIVQISSFKATITTNGISFDFQLVSFASHTPRPESSDTFTILYLTAGAALFPWLLLLIYLYTNEFDAYTYWFSTGVRGGGGGDWVWGLRRLLAAHEISIFLCNPKFSRYTTLKIE